MAKPKYDRLSVRNRTVTRKSSIGGLYVCAKGLDNPKFDKNSTDL